MGIFGWIIGNASEVDLKKIT